VNDESDKSIEGDDVTSVERDVSEME